MTENKQMERKQVTFLQIVEMISAGTVPEGAVFYTPADVGTDKLARASVSPDGYLTWDGTLNAVGVSPCITNDVWYMDTSVVRLSALEAMAELQKGNSVKTITNSVVYTLSPFEDFDNLWEFSPWGDMDELLNKTAFYKVEQ